MLTLLSLLWQTNKLAFLSPTNTVTDYKVLTIAFLRKIPNLLEE